MFVIVETTNEHRGSDAVYSVIGPYRTEAEALAVQAELSAFLPSEYDSHDDYPLDYTVRRASMFVRVIDDGVEVAS